MFQRPQHLMTRCARDRRVFFVEEPVFSGSAPPHLALQVDRGVTVATPRLPDGLSDAATNSAQASLVAELLQRQRIDEYVLWYYTPMALGFTADLSPLAIIYDCMDELAAFKDAPSRLKTREASLMRKASLVFTGGQSLYEAKQHLHPCVHAFPSSVDVEHFAGARRITTDPADQAPIPRPRLGFFGVIDERMDLELLDGLAAARPEWHIVILGPVVKIDPVLLPHRPNIHYLGPKSYGDLPHYVAGWDVTLLPFARNEATRYISPTKTPEYMAAGKPVVSTSIRDVVRPYGRQGLVRIADDVPGFVRACTAAMAEDPVTRVTSADAFLRQTSWDGTWSRMRRLVDGAVLRTQSGTDADASASRTAV